MSNNAIRNFATENNLNENNESFHHNMIANLMENDIAIDNTSQAMTESIEEEFLNEFKENVKQWLELDQQIKRLTTATKERRKKKNEINLKIVDFMHKYNIEDLNTKDGIIRYKTTYVKEPLSQKTIKIKLIDMFKNDKSKMEEIENIFTNRAKVEKISLKRLKL